MIILCSLYNNSLAKDYFCKHPRILFISATNSSEYAKDFKLFKRSNKSISKDITWMDWKKVPKSLISYDVVFLAGGNTYEFSNNLHKHGFRSKLQEFLAYHKVLVAESAGAICLTPSIRLASIPAHSADEKPRKVHTYKGLDIIGFELSPHYVEDTDELELAEYSKTCENNITMLEDDEYLVLAGGLWKI